MGTHKKMVNAGPTSLCSALMRPKKNKKNKLHFFPARPIIWSCHMSVTASRQFVTTIPYHYIPDSWSSIFRWVLNIQWSTLKVIVMCMYALLYISVWTSCARVLYCFIMEVFKHNLILFFISDCNFFLKVSFTESTGYMGGKQKKGTLSSVFNL